LNFPLNFLAGEAGLSAFPFFFRFGFAAVVLDFGDALPARFLLFDRETERSELSAQSVIRPVTKSDQSASFQFKAPVDAQQFVIDVNGDDFG